MHVLACMHTAHIRTYSWALHLHDRYALRARQKLGLEGVI